MIDEKELGSLASALRDIADGLIAKDTEIACLKGRLKAIVEAAAGTTNEGCPVSSINIIERVRELVEMERK